MGGIGAAETVALNSCFTVQVMLVVSLRVLVLPVGSHLVGCVDVFPLFGGTGGIIRG